MEGLHVAFANMAAQAKRNREARSSQIETVPKASTQETEGLSLLPRNLIERVRTRNLQRAIINLRPGSYLERIEASSVETFYSEKLHQLRIQRSSQDLHAHAPEPTDFLSLLAETFPDDLHCASDGPACASPPVSPTTDQAHTKDFIFTANHAYYQLLESRAIQTREEGSALPHATSTQR